MEMKENFPFRCIKTEHAVPFFIQIFRKFKREFLVKWKALASKSEEINVVFFANQMQNEKQSSFGLYRI